MKPNRVMVVGGGEWQVPIIKKAKEMGLQVVNTNLYEDSPGFKYADYFEVADILDYEKNLEIANRYNPAAIITDQSDIAVPTVAKLCEDLGLKGITVEKANLFTNKYLMRLFCEKNGFEVPKYKLCQTFDEVTSAAKEIGYPLVLKPINNQSSRGVNVVFTQSELNIKYNNTILHSKDGNLLVEEFIDGKEFTVEGFKFSDKHLTLAISEKEHLNDNISIAIKLVYKDKSDEYDYNILKKINNDLVEKMNLPFGITHAEYKYRNNKFYLIEIAARGGGTKISSHIIPAISNIDVNSLLIKSAMGEDINSTNINVSPKGVAILEFFVLPTGKVKKISGEEKIKSMPGVLDFRLNFTQGDTITEPDDDRSRVGFYIAFAKNLMDLRRISNIVKDSLEVIYDEG